MKIQSKTLKQALTKVKEVCSPVSSVKLRGKGKVLCIEAAKTPYSIVAILKLPEKLDSFSCVLDFNTLFSVVKATGTFEFELRENFTFKQGNMTGNIPLLPDYGFDIEKLETDTIDSTFLFDNLDLYTLKDLKFEGGEADVYVESTGNSANVYCSNYLSGCIANFKAGEFKDFVIPIDAIRKLAKFSSKLPYDLGVSDSFIFARVETQDCTFMFNASLSSETKVSPDSVTATLKGQQKSAKFVSKLDTDEMLSFLNDCKAITDKSSVVEITYADKKLKLRISTPKGNNIVTLDKVKVSVHKEDVDVQVSYDYLMFLCNKVKGKAYFSISERALILEYKKPRVSYLLGLL